MINEIAPTSQQPERARPRLRITDTVYAPEPIGVTETALRWPSLEGIASRAEAGVDHGFEDVYYIKGELPGGHWLHYAVPVRIRIEGSEFVAEQPQLALHAFGGYPMEALFNLREEIVEQYTRLQELSGRLSPPLIRQRELLRFLLTSKDA